MNYQKLDAALAMAVNQVQNPQERSFVIFIHTQPILESAAKIFLTDLGISEITDNNKVFTATVSFNQIAELSQQHWIEGLKLSQGMSFVNPG